MTLLELLIKKGYGNIDAEKKIRAGHVMVNDVEVIWPLNKMKEKDTVLIKESKQWVSRGAQKALYAIEFFKLDLNDKCVLDVGSSTGGFTQASLKNGAKKVYALDVGTNQLDFSLRRDKRVFVIENTNLKRITKEMFAEEVDIVLVDVSFISLREVFKVLKHSLKNKVKIMALIKPQYEAFSDQVLKGGFVSEELHQEIINRVIKHAKDNSFVYLGHTKSPIKGQKSKNTEYVSLFERIENE